MPANIPSFFYIYQTKAFLIAVNNTKFLFAEDFYANTK